MDPKTAITAFCKVKIKALSRLFPKISAIPETLPEVFALGKVRAFDQVINELERFEKTYTISAILSMLESQYQEPITKEARELMIKEMDHFEGLN